MKRIAKFERFSPAMAPQPAPAPAPTRTPTPTPTPAPTPTPSVPPKPEPPKRPDRSIPRRIPQPETPEQPLAKGKKVMGFDSFAAFGDKAAKGKHVDETDVADRFISEMQKKGQSVKKFMEKR
jgi:hypothetical protein